MAETIKIVSPEMLQYYDGKIKNYIDVRDGDLTQLVTTNKSNLTAAINEVDALVEVLKQQVGVRVPEVNEKVVEDDSALGGYRLAEVTSEEGVTPVTYEDNAINCTQAIRDAIVAAYKVVEDKNIWERLIALEESADDDYKVLVTPADGGEDDTFIKKYSFFQGKLSADSTGIDNPILPTIDIPKDMVVQNGEMVRVVTDKTAFPTSGATYYNASGEEVADVNDSATIAAVKNGVRYETPIADKTVADKTYLKLYIKNGTAQNTPVYIDASTFGTSFIPKEYTDEEQAAAGFDPLGKISLILGTIDDDTTNYLRAELLDGSIGADQIVDGSVTFAKLSGDTTVEGETVKGVATKLNDGVDAFDAVGGWKTEGGSGEGFSLPEYYIKDFKTTIDGQLSETPVSSKTIEGKNIYTLEHFSYAQETQTIGKENFVFPDGGKFAYYPFGPQVPGPNPVSSDKLMYAAISSSNLAGKMPKDGVMHDNEFNYDFTLETINSLKETYNSIDMATLYIIFENEGGSSNGYTADTDANIKAMSDADGGLRKEILELQDKHADASAEEIAAGEKAIVDGKLTVAQEVADAINELELAVAPNGSNAGNDGLMPKEDAARLAGMNISQDAVTGDITINIPKNGTDGVEDDSITLQAVTTSEIDAMFS